MAMHAKWKEDLINSVNAKIVDSELMWSST
jgi:hypothetical protein